MRANFQKNYLMRYAALAGICLVIAAWFAYDGLVGYPANLPAAEAYDELRDLDSAKRAEEWKRIAAERGLNPQTPKKTAAEIRSDIIGQYFWGAVNLLVGLPALLLWIRSRGSWIEQTEDGLTTSWGQTLRFADVTRLDKKKWRHKGIAKATYTPMTGGRPQVFVFDDFKFDREPLGKMLRDLESQLRPDQIVGGPAESLPDS